jgi:xylulokinase
VVADLTGRPVIVPDAHELVALGAAVQAAVVLTGSSFREISDAWGLGAGQTVEPDTTVDAAAIRQAYATAVER